jgi:hypothetical protein
VEFMSLLEAVAKFKTIEMDMNLAAEGILTELAVRVRDRATVLSRQLSNAETSDPQTRAYYHRVGQHLFDLAPAVRTTPNPSLTP